MADYSWYQGSNGGYGGYGGYGGPYSNAVYSGNAAGNSAVSKAASFQGLFNFMAAALLMTGIIKTAAMSQNRRRKRNVGLGDVFAEDSNVFFRVLSDLDQENCIAMAVCHASTFDVFNSERNQKLLMALGIEKETPVPWKELTGVRAKYQYAAFVGNTLKPAEVDKGCSLAFPRCALPAEDVLKLLTNEVRSCEAMMNSLEQLWPHQNRGTTTNTTTTPGPV